MACIQEAKKPCQLKQTNQPSTGLFMNKIKFDMNGTDFDFVVETYNYANKTHRLNDTQHGIGKIKNQQDG